MTGCWLQLSGTCLSCWRDVEVLGFFGKTALSHESCCFPLQPKPLREHRVVFLSQTQEIKTLQSKGFSEMHQAGVVINFGWGPPFWLSVCVLLEGRGLPIPANHVWHYPVYKLAAWHSLLSTHSNHSRRFCTVGHQFKLLGSMSVPTEISGNLAAALNESQMRPFCDSWSHLQRKSRYCWQQQSHFALPNISSPISMGKGFVRSYKDIMAGNWGLQQDRQQFHLDCTLELDCPKDHSRKPSYVLLFKV